MYSRSGGVGRDRRGDYLSEDERMPPKRHTSEMIPPNYGGSAFGRFEPDDGNAGEIRGEHFDADGGRRPSGPPAECDRRDPRPPRPSGGLIPGGLQGDDVLLLGLLALLLAGGADDDIIIMLVFLLVSTLAKR